MISQRIQRSSSVRDACDRFLADLGVWVRTCLERYASEPPTDGHDQATYTTSWTPYIRRTEDRDAYAFLTSLRDKIAAHFHRTDQWRHGYWRMQEVHHGTEHFELFLGALHRLNPDDSDTIAHFIDAAEHTGNWCADAPPWFDHEHSVYRSMYLGTDGVRTEPGMEVNVPDHFRCFNISLLAYTMTGERRYLDLVVRGLSRWVEAIDASDVLPAGLLPDRPLYTLDGDAHAAHRRFAGQAPDLHAPVDRAENFLASNAVRTFLITWHHTRDARFLQAAHRLLDIIATRLSDPEAGPAADILRTYRRLTGDHRYDRQILDAAAALPPEPVTALGIDPAPVRTKRPAGIGKRQDMPDWYEDGRPRRRNPILLSAAAEITNDASLAAYAVDLARTYFNLAREVYPDGRHHGCSARSVSAVARGHGRDNDAGMVTAVLEPVWQAFLTNGADPSDATNPL